MFFHDWFMRDLKRVLKNEDLNKPQPHWKPSSVDTPARMQLVFDGIKLIGSGNGAGALASIAAMNYFSARAELHFPMKIAAIFYLSGLLVFALSILAYIFGLPRFMDFGENYSSIKAGKIPIVSRNKLINSVIGFLFSTIGMFVSLACFFIGTSVATYVVFNF
jgi:hypothetical protein